MPEEIISSQAQLPDLLIIGVALLVGWLAHAAGQQIRAPRVTLLLILGMVAGPSMLNLIPAGVEEWFPLVSHIALAMIGFLLGESLVGRDVKTSGKTVLLVSIGETLGAAAAVFALLWLAGVPLPMAMLLAGIAPATAPAATYDVIREIGASGPLSDTVKGVVAIDDAWGVIVFSLFLVAVEAMDGGNHIVPELVGGFWEIAGAILLGIAIGIPMAYMTGRLKEGEPTLVEAAGFVFLCGGIALVLELSFLLACMALGATVANRARHHSRPFHEIEGASDPFLVMFFLLAGYEADLEAMKLLGVIAVAYIVGRSAGLVLGGNVMALLARAPRVVRRHVGWCLLPQAGVAIGLALLVAERLPKYGEDIQSLIIGTTVFFEVFAPLVTAHHLRRAGEV